MFQSMLHCALSLRVYKLLCNLYNLLTLQLERGSGDRRNRVSAMYMWDMSGLFTLECTLQFQHIFSVSAVTNVTT